MKLCGDEWWIMQQRIQTIRKGMTVPNRRFRGCLATKIQPEDYTTCLNEYDDERFEHIELIPSALKKLVHETTENVELRTALGQTVGNPKVALTDFPKGLRHYMKTYPTEFKNYFNERKHELQFLKSLVRNLNLQEKEALRDHYSKNKDMTFEDFQDVVVGQKIKKSNGGRTNGGCSPCNGGSKGCERNSLMYADNVSIARSDTKFLPFDDDRDSNASSDTRYTSLFD